MDINELTMVSPRRRSRRRARFIAATASAERSEARFNPSAHAGLPHAFVKSHHRAP